MTRITLGIQADRPCHRSGRTHGFTLVELLVVIGIMLLLMSILLPSLNAAMRSAERAACAANLRSIGQAYTLYTGESNGRYPNVNTTVGPNGPWGLPLVGAPPLVGKADGIAIVLSQGYIPDPRILYCPGGDDTTSSSTASTGNRGTGGIDNLQFWAEGKRTDVWHPGPGPGGMHQTGYAIWAGWLEPYENAIPPDPRANWFASGLKEKGGRVLASDHMVRGATQYEDWNGHLAQSRKRVGTAHPNLPGQPVYPNDPDPDSGVTFAGGNVLYNDGHVEWRSTTDTVFRIRHATGFDIFW